MTGNPVIEKATLAQNQAADPSSSIWVSANAGTGKTRVLTNRILRLLLDGNRAADILAVTYTRAAASEMRNRLFGELAGWAVSDGTSLEDKLKKVGIRQPSMEQTGRARKLFATLLDEPVGIRIETIHAFSQSVLRRFPIEADLQPWFDIATDSQAAGMKHEAVSNVLRSGEPRVVEALAELVRDHAETTLREQVESLMRYRRTLEALGRDPAAVEKSLYAALGWEHAVGNPEQARQARLEEFIDNRASENNLERVVGFLEKGGVEDKRRAARIRTWLNADDGARQDLWPIFHRAFHTEKGERNKRLATKKVIEACRDVVEVLAEEAERVDALARDLHGLETARQSFHLMVVAEALLRRYDRLKGHAGLLDYQDLIDRTLGLLGGIGGMNWVRYKLDRGINHLLIDEAQDTSPDQWEIISSIADEFFETEKPDGPDDGRSRSLFSVGDFKQSIYSFQGAAPELFNSSGEHFEDKAGTAKRDFERVELNASFRSVAPVLNLVDHISRGNGLAGIDGETHHEIVRTGQGGFVEILDCLEKDDPAKPDPYVAKIARETATDIEIDLAQRIVETIASWIDKRPLPSRGRTVQPGDILILVRRRDGFHAALDRQLRLAGLPVAGADRVRLNQDIAVLDLIALGRAMLLPGDDLNLAALLKSPLFGLSEEDLFRLAYDRGEATLFQRLGELADTDKTMGEAHDRLAGWLGLAELHTPYGFFRRVLDDGCRRDFARRLGNHIGDVLAEFLEMARQYEAAFPASMINFLEFMGETDAEIVRESSNRGENEIRIMTVHGAKGLESPIVILPDALRAGTPSNRVLELKSGDLVLPILPASDMPAKHKAIEDAADAAKRKQEEEDDRLFYVAMTRAQDGLLVAGYKARNRRFEEGSWYERVAVAMSALDAERDESSGLYRLESPQEGKPSDDGDREASAAAGPVPDLPDWMVAMPAREETPPRPLSPSRLAAEEDSFSPVGREGNTSLELGRLAHRMLEILPPLEGEARARAAERLVATAELYSLPEEAARGMLEKAEGLLADPATAGLFGADSRSEVPVSGLVGDIVVSGVIDRLLVEEGRVTIVDFKTGAFPGKGQEAKPAHLRQLAVYRALMRQIWPEREVRAGLVYTENASVEWLDEGKMDAEVARLGKKTPESQGAES